MTLLFWVGSYAPDAGGVAVAAQALARSLAARGHTVVVVTQSAGDDESADRSAEGWIHRLPFHQVLASRDPDRVAALTRRVAAIRRDCRPDIVHAHAIHPSAFFLLRTASVAPCPIVFTIHGWTELQGTGAVRSRLLHASARVIGVSESVTERTIREEPTIRGRALTIHNGCVDPSVAPAPLPFDPPVVTFAGRLVEQKGVDRLIAAMPGLLSREPRLRLEIIGGGPERDALERMADRLGVAAQTEFVGAIDREDVFDRLNRATIVAIPSRGSEGLPMIALEAALMARPVVATHGGGNGEAVVDGQTGFLVENDDRGEDLRGALSRLLASPALAERLGQAGRRRALEMFDWTAHVARYCALYEEVRSRPTQ